MQGEMKKTAGHAGPGGERPMSDEQRQQQRPTADDLARDLRADLALCEAASDPPWRLDEDERLGLLMVVSGLKVVTHDSYVGPYQGAWMRRDFRMLAAARSALPAAIRRALWAEPWIERAQAAEKILAGWVKINEGCGGEGCNAGGGVRLCARCGLEEMALREQAEALLSRP